MNEQQLIKWLNSLDYTGWKAECLAANAGHTLAVGDRVRDIYGAVGMVKDINDWSKHGPLTIENHGTVTVELERGNRGEPVDPEYGDEHYCYINWAETLKVI